MLLIFSSILCACIFMFFCFGYIHHMEQKDIDGESGENTFIAYFYDLSWPVEKRLDTVRMAKVTKGEIVERLLELDERVLSELEVTLECKLIDDVVDDIAIDNSSLSLATEFIIEDGEILPPRIEESLKSKNLLTEGRYFTDDDYRNARLVCIPPAYYGGNFEGAYEYLYDRYAQREDGTYLIDGKEYLAIGKLESFSSIPDVPVTTIGDDVFVKNITFVFEHPITRYEYEAISSLLMTRYGEQVMITPLEIETADSKRFDRSLTLMVLSVSAVSMIMVSFLYEYLISRRTAGLKVFLLCGMTPEQIKRILSTEVFLVSILSCITAVILYHSLLLPVLERRFEYIGRSAVFSVYLTIVLAYIAFGFIITRISIARRLR